MTLTPTPTRPQTRATPPPGGGAQRSTGLSVDRTPPYSEAATPEGDAEPQCDGCGGGGRLIACYWGQALCDACGRLAEEAFERDGWPRAPWEVTLDQRVMVLGEWGLIHASGALTAWCPGSLRELAGVAERLGVTEVWVHESALERLDWPLRLDRLAAGAGEAHPFFDDAGDYQCRYPTPAGLIHYARWFRPGGHGIDLHVPTYSVSAAKSFRSPFGGLESAHHLAWAVALYREAAGDVMPWRGNGAQTSAGFLRARYRRGGALKATEVAPPWTDKVAGEVDAIWAREPTVAEQRARYLMAFDLNGQYLSAASTLALPAGPVEHRDHFPDLREVDPGYWLCEMPAWSGPGPCPWRVDRHGGPVWVTTPTAWLAQRQHDVVPLEAWVWPEHHQFLRPWYEHLKRAREVAGELTGPALSAVKLTYKAGLGYLETKPAERKGGATDALYQPYWSEAVTAQARCNLHRRIAQLSVEPLAVYVDCLYFLTNSTNPGAFCARAGIPLGDGLGQFKQRGRRVSGRAAREALASTRGPLAAVSAFDELVGG